MRKAAVLATAGLVLAVTLSGCLSVHRPIVPVDIVTNADHQWRVTEGEEAGERGFAPQSIETTYRHDPDGGASYPGLLVLVGLRTVQRISEDQLLEAAEELLNEEMTAQGIEADTVTRDDGKRTLRSGINTQWISMRGESTSDSFLFSNAREVRVFAEAWFDDASNMHVVAIAIAQTGGTDFVGQPRTDLAVWNELVGDDAGTVDGAKHPEGFIDHAVVQN